MMPRGPQKLLVTVDIAVTVCPQVAAKTVTDYQDKLEGIIPKVLEIPQTTAQKIVTQTYYKILLCSLNIRRMVAWTLTIVIVTFRVNISNNGMQGIGL